MFKVIIFIEIKFNLVIFIGTNIEEFFDKTHVRPISDSQPARISLFVNGKEQIIFLEPAGSPEIYRYFSLFFLSRYS